MSDSIVPYLCCDGASKAIAYYVTVFGPTRSSAGPAPDRRIGHAEVRIAGHSVYLADEHPEMGVRSPLTLGGRSVSMVVTVPDPDAVMAIGLEQGATLDRPVTDQPMGFRGG